LAIAIFFEGVRYFIQDNVPLKRVCRLAFKSVERYAECDTDKWTKRQTDKWL